jgi:hypothetical protein
VANDQQDNQIGDRYEEDGYFVRVKQDSILRELATVGSLASNYTGSPALYSESSINEIIFGSVATTNFHFNMISIDLSNLETADGTDVTFTGTRSYIDEVTNQLVFETVYQTFTIDDYFGMQTFYFSEEFNSLLSVTWFNTETFHQFDNIVVEGTAPTVPLPAALPLLITGFAGLMAAARRQRGRAKPKTTAPWPASHAKARGLFRAPSR